jgi:hypothetical protein
MRKFFMTFAVLAFATTATVAAINLVAPVPAAACELDRCSW